MNIDELENHWHEEAARLKAERAKANEPMKLCGGLGYGNCENMIRVSQHMCAPCRREFMADPDAYK